MSEEGFGRWRENQEYVAVAASHDLLSHMWHSSSVYRRRCVKQRERSENLPVPYFLFFFFYKLQQKRSGGGILLKSVCAKSDVGYGNFLHLGAKAHKHQQIHTNTG